MPRRQLDTSRARCDVCGKPYQDGDAVYSVADKFDESVEDRDVLVSFRHWDCHTPTDVLIKQMQKSVDEASKRAQAAFNELRSSLRDRDATRHGGPCRR